MNNLCLHVEEVWWIDWKCVWSSTAWLLCLLVARDVTRGQETVASLEKEGLHPKFHQLDIDNQESIERLRQFLVDNYGGLDILVNNAGIAYAVWKQHEV